ALRATRDVSQTRYVFEAMGNFPIYDILNWGSRRLPLLRDPRFIEFHRRRPMPDLTTGAVLKMLETHAPETLGYEYARFVESWRLDNMIPSWSHLDLDDPVQFLIHRVVLVHDLIHFILGFPPVEKLGEQEVEAFLLAQTGAWNHVLFLAGYFLHALRSEPRNVVGQGILRRWREAYAYGKRAENLLLVDWEALMDRPIEDVRRELRVDERPTVRAPRPKAAPQATPRLAHVVLNVPDRAATVRFYTEVFGYRLAGCDDRLGVTFLTAGDDHHTIAVQECVSFGPRSGPKSLLANLRRGASLLRSRIRGERSAETGLPTALPPWAIVRASLRPGLNHMGFRVADEAELGAYVQRLRDTGVRVEWAVNHADMVKGIYFRDAGGNLCEIFCDGARVPEVLERIRAGEIPEGSDAVDIATYELDLDRIAGGALDAHP
ncbi:MAG: VOC family protein, partial [Myxococcales bacterium]|nr:VOC family protein [Myxococcales bacterium]